MYSSQKKKCYGPLTLNGSVNVYVLYIIKYLTDHFSPWTPMLSYKLSEAKLCVPQCETKVE